MSSNFLQRFKGKTQIISKQGVHNILGGGGNINPQILTHGNGLPSNKKIGSSKSHADKNTTNEFSKKSQRQHKVSILNDNKKSKKPEKAYQKQKQVINQNPFLISNPFYLDEQQKKRQQQQRKQLQRQQRLQKQANRLKQDPKKGTFTSGVSGRRDSINKKTEKQWVKMGGLGPNLGGQQWQERRKKQQKMQQFANQVKAVNTQKAKQVPKSTTVYKKQQTKDNPRTKALEYSKNIPKPVLKSYQKQEQLQEQSNPIKQINQNQQNQLSQLQTYQLRHKQLKEMLKNQF